MPHKEAIAPGEKVVFDGVQYSLSVKQVGQHYHGSWLCMDCKIRGNASQECLTHDEAMECIESGLRLHHVSSHNRHVS